jgi:hypothetical protein
MICSRVVDYGLYCVWLTFFQLFLFFMGVKGNRGKICQESPLITAESHGGCYLSPFLACGQYFGNIAGPVLITKPSSSAMIK